MEDDDDYDPRAIVKVGYLVKRGQSFKSWNKRWFVLRSDGSLSYYTSETGSNYLGGVQVPVATCHICPDKVFFFPFLLLFFSLLLDHIFFFQLILNLGWPHILFCCDYR